MQQELGRGVQRRSEGASFLVHDLMAAFFCLAAALMPTDAKADSFAVTGPSTIPLFWNFSTPLSNSLTANATMNVSSFSSSEVLLGVTINNTTSNYVVSSFGFNTNPAVTASFTSSGAVFDGVSNDVTFPGFQTIEVCTFTSANCSSSTNGEALQANSGDSFGLRLTGSFGSSLALSTFAMKFAGGPEGSFEVAGRVPLPGTLLLFGAGFALFVTWHRRAECAIRRPA